jgi:UDP-N-acetylmuramate dehydrogenase
MTDAADLDQQTVDRGLRLRMAEDALRQATAGSIRRDVDLRSLSWWRIGGLGKLLVEPQSAREVQDCLAALARLDVPVLVIGDGSNLLFDDAGFDGVIVRIGRALGRIAIHDDVVTAEAGVWVPCLARRVAQAGLTGIEHVAGIPGTMGGLVIMNGGSQRKSIGSSIVRVSGVDLKGQPFSLHRDECAFRYRGSRLQDKGLIILETELTLKRGSPEAIRREMLGILIERRRKFPRKLPQCGSVFLSDPAMYASVGPPGAAIEKVGLKGRRMGGAQISPLHANFFVNVGDATSAQMLSLIRLARDTVFASTGFWMNCEVRHVSPTGRVIPAHEVM